MSCIEEPGRLISTDPMDSLLGRIFISNKTESLRVISGIVKKCFVQQNLKVCQVVYDDGNEEICPEDDILKLIEETNKENRIQRLIIYILYENFI
jgi:hypothetical protein